MSVRRRRPPSEAVAHAGRALRRAEGAIALLDRVRPLGLAEERARLLSGFEAGRRERPALRYAPAPALGDVRRELETLANADAAGDLEARLLAERARELSLEAELAEHVGAPQFAQLAARRFPLPPDAARYESLARELLAMPLVYEPAEPLHASDDPSDPLSLWSEVSRLLSRERFAVRIQVVPGLVSLAAVADGVVRVRAGARLTASVAARIALHEVEGHVRPRVLGAGLSGVFVAGSARASEDEEGRAIWLEQQAGLLDAERARELARRYLAAASVRGGAELWDTVELLGRTGSTAAAAIELACRVHRGGGLGREVIYLTGYDRAVQAFARRPELSRVQSSGRVSLDAAAALLDDSVELDDHRNMI